MFIIYTLFAMFVYGSSICLVLQLFFPDSMDSEFSTIDTDPLGPTYVIFRNVTTAIISSYLVTKGFDWFF